VKYAVVLTPAAEEDLRGMPEAVRQRVARWVRRLADNPRPHGIVPTKSQPAGTYRGRVGGYRVGFEVVDAAREVRIWEVAGCRHFYDEAERRH